MPKVVTIATLYGVRHSDRNIDSQKGSGLICKLFFLSI